MFGVQFTPSPLNKNLSMPPIRKLTQIIDASWPVADRDAMKKDSIELVVQVNGKLRARLDVPAAADKAAIEAQALEAENVRRHTEGKTIRKVIVVPGKLVNIVAN